MMGGWPGAHRRPNTNRPRPQYEGVPATSDEGIALRYGAEYADDQRYVAAWRGWFGFTGDHWAEDRTLAAFDSVRALCRTVAVENRESAKALASAKTVAAVHTLCRSDRRLVATTDQWDADPWLLNTPAGGVDLRTGRMSKHRREDYCSKITAVAPGGECPLWDRFLDTVTGRDNDLKLFLQRVAGYSLTGLTREHAFFFLYGTGVNGKSVFLGTLSGIMGGYAATAPIETFIASHAERHPTDLAGLRGARLVTAVETEAGRRWAESKLKMLTGGDKIAARFMRQDFFEFTPQFKLLIAGNHRPGLRSVDDAIKRRLHLVPFTVTIPEEDRDDQLAEKLRDEWPGILAWAIEGAADWFGESLRPPSAVTTATENYFADEDLLALWLAECCKPGEPKDTRWTTDLFNDWKAWCERAGERPGRVNQFSHALVQRGYERGRDAENRSIFYGIILNPARPV